MFDCSIPGVGGLPGVKSLQFLVCDGDGGDTQLRGDFNVYGDERARADPDLYC